MFSNMSYHFFFSLQNKSIISCLSCKLQEPTSVIFMTSVTTGKGDIPLFLCVLSTVQDCLSKVHLFCFCTRGKMMVEHILQERSTYEMQRKRMWPTPYISSREAARGLPTPADHRLLLEVIQVHV